MNPSQSDDSETNDEDENDDANKEVITYLMCACSTQLTTKRIMIHTFENHSVKGAYVCLP